MSVHSGIGELSSPIFDSDTSVHMSVMLASSNGSLMVWTARPAKFIQPLAPNFIEIEENVVYVEREDEFESELSDDQDLMDIDDDILAVEQLIPKQKKLNQ